MEQKILVYGKCGGYATVATFLGNQWWVTNKDERLEPLYGDSTYDQSDYRYLCELGELVQMRDLAGMIARAGGGDVVFELPDEVERAGYSTATKALMDGSKLHELGWKPMFDFPTGIAHTVELLRAFG
jgi:nucleoside-diphosphate-sugar epimerase